MLHTQARRSRELVLVVAPGGSRLQRSADDGGQSAKHVDEKGRLVFQNTTMVELALFLGGAGPTTVDMTQLKGRFDFALEYRKYMSEDLDSPMRSGTLLIYDALRRAVEAQLGLRFKEQLVSVRTVVVDHAERAPIDQ